MIIYCILTMTFDKEQTCPVFRDEAHKEKNVNVQTKISSLAPDGAGFQDESTD
jgi:hypothetical protein